MINSDVTAIEVHWRGELKSWQHTEAAMMMLYLVLIADMIDNPLLAALVFVVSHALIIVLEGLIMFIQTTRRPYSSSSFAF